MLVILLLLVAFVEGFGAAREVEAVSADMAYGNTNLWVFAFTLGVVGMEWLVESGLLRQALIN